MVKLSIQDSEGRTTVVPRPRHRSIRPSRTRGTRASRTVRTLTPKPEYTMLGRTYSIGYENDLEHVLFARPISRLCDPELPWAVWYPLRRSGTFEKLPFDEQKAILAEHGKIGATYSAAGFGNDIRLACHGLDKNDNDFVIGLLGKNLHPLSAMVQTMRKTRQTSEFLTNLGPFFIGHVLWQSPVKVAQG